MAAGDRRSPEGDRAQAELLAQPFRGRIPNYRAGKLEEAARAYQRVTELQPDSARGYHMLGTVQQSAGDLTSALANYEKATSIRPAASTHSNVGTVLFWRGNYTGAADAYTRAIALTPHQPDLHATSATPC